MSEQLTNIALCLLNPVAVNFPGEGFNFCILGVGFSYCNPGLGFNFYEPEVEFNFHEPGV